MRSLPRPAKNAVAATVLTAAFGLTAAIGALTRDANGVEALWLSTGLLTAALLLTRGPWALAVVGVCLPVNVAVYMTTGDGPAAAIVFSTINMIEAIASAWLARLVLGPSLQLKSILRVAKLLLLAVAPATAVGALLAASAGVVFGRSFDEILGAWFFASGVGSAVALPAVLLAVRERDRARAPLWEQLAIYAAIAIFAVVVTHFTQFPLHLAFFLGLILAAFRVGARGVGIGVLVLTIVAAAGVLAHPHSGLNPAWTMADRMQMLTFIIALASLSSMATAMTLSTEQRLRQLWAGRSRIARRAEARARAACKARDEFLATMSHEIRTPMNSILGFADVLGKRTDLPAAARRQIDLIARAGDSLMTTVDHILTFSELELEGVELDEQPYALSTLARDTLAIVSPAAKEKGLALDLTIAGEADAPVMIDELRLRQVLLNLLSNAVKFTDAGRVRLDVLYDSTNDRARFTVSDTGVGVPDEKIGALFQPFSRLDGSTTRSNGGAGLGLAIAKSLVEAMGGEIGVDAGVAQGAVFWLEIPVAPAKTNAPQIELPGVGARVLLVDDHATNRELGVTVLQLLGCDVKAVENGREAVMAVQTDLFDVILMDVHMPKMDGLEATRAIRKLGGEAARTPIIAMSADVSPAMTKRCYQAGMVDALGKPIQINGLHEMLVKWVGRSADPAAHAA